MNLQLDRNWVKTLVVSLPDYATDLGDKLQLAMTEKVLDDVDAHACALGGALACGYGELAFEISMDNTLRGNEIREEIAKTVIDLMIDNPIDNPKLYTLAIAYVLKDPLQISEIVNKLTLDGVEIYEIEAVHRIARLVSAIGKCLI